LRNVDYHRQSYSNTDFMLKGLIERFERQLWARRSHKFVIRNWSQLPDLATLGEVLSSMRASRDIMPILQEVPGGKRILVIAPHPDDEMIGPGGTIIGAIEAGSKVHVVYLTSGAKQPDAVRTREMEASAAATQVGYTTEFLRLTDLLDSVTDLAQTALAKAIKASDPELIFVSFFADDHIEHQRASELLIKACDQGLIGGGAEVWAYQVYTALLGNVIVDVTPFLERKSEAIGMFASQMRSRNWAHFASGLTAYNSRFLSGNATRHAEVFHVAPLRDYSDIARPYFD
jgi:N-acetylglucosamine malate deacetylase 1